MPVPSAHNPSNTNHTNQKEGSMPIESITENNPFLPETEKNMKITFKKDNGELHEYKLWYVDTPAEQMTNMQLVKAVLQATQMAKMFENNNWDLQRTKLMSTGQYKWNDIQETVVVDDNYLDCQNAVKKFLTEALEKADTHNHDPLCTMSFRVLSNVNGPKSYWGDGSNDSPKGIVINEILMKEMKPKSGNIVLIEDENGNLTHEIPGDKYGFVIEFKSYRYTNNGQHYVINWPGVALLNKTPNGWRIMWKNMKTGKAMFGETYVTMNSKKLVPHCHGMQFAYEDFIRKYIKPKDVLPILNWINCNIPDEQAEHTHPYGITASDIYWIGSETSVKKILNKAYGNQANGVTKKIFGDINYIGVFSELRAAIHVVRAMRGFKPQVFEKISLTDIPEEFFSAPLHFGNDIANFFKTFGYRERFVAEIFSGYNLQFDYMGRNARIVRLISDTMTMYRNIRSKRHRAAIKAHVAHHKLHVIEIHDYVQVEAAKATSVNRDLSKAAINRKYAKFAGKEIAPGITMVLPNSTHDLVEWGATQNNCIGGWGGYIENGAGMIVGFKDDNNEWIGHAQIDADMTLVQLLGKHNSYLPTKQREAIVEFLKKELKAKVDRFWGKGNN